MDSFEAELERYELMLEMRNDLFDIMDDDASPSERRALLRDQLPDATSEELDGFVANW